MASCSKLIGLPASAPSNQSFRGSAQVLLGRIPGEVQQWLTEVKRILHRSCISLGGVDLPTLLLGRALEVDLRV